MTFPPIVSDDKRYALANLVLRDPFVMNEPR